ncbi:hypothetical protein BT96DRAFT_993650 [Gymnopus androsaceus JB14]|uniref:Uncharacterized protein n=1 Tax=Gymnopus androsaceus JB14 TaxID=1447944 RepID=A0A6A4HPB0_9AGAR|nr:hypothetical protein BT96DRAFT_993650 [Gymnopus androsaceus JB14]
MNFQASHSLGFVGNRYLLPFVAVHICGSYDRAFMLQFKLFLNIAGVLCLQFLLVNWCLPYLTSIQRYPHMQNSDTSPISRLQKPSHASSVDTESITKCVSTSLSMIATNHNNNDSPPVYRLIIHPPLFTGDPLADVPSKDIINETPIHNEIVFVCHIKCAIVNDADAGTSTTMCIDLTFDSSMYKYKFGEIIYDSQDDNVPLSVGKVRSD